ncbi:unnamed protein product [Rhizophagus irregularis]|nr:unnamed protein product [Rhizophagus irregularis]CAB4417461.1 unnamed protein product [Rhizophagus irregularis]
MDPTARKAVNLNVLRRHDQNIVEIIDSSSYVVVYKFDQGAWTKKGVEGTLFVFKRCVQPVYGFIVMNRLGIDNFMAPLTDGMELEFKDEYIIYRTTDDVDNIHGIWVFETKDRERIGKTLLECRESSKTAVTPPQLTLQPPYYSSNTPTSSKGTSSSLYGRPIQIGDLLQQAEINQPTTSNNSRSSTPAYHDTLQYETPKKDILGELFQKASSIDPLPVNPPVTSSNNHTLLDGKMLLDMLRPSNTATASPNNYPFNSHTPPQRSLSVNDTRPNNKLFQSRNINTPSIIQEHITTSNASFGMENPQLSRKQAVDASISSLTALEGINHKRILTKSEFTEQYLRLIQSDPSFMDILYENYVVKAQNML